MYRHYTVLARVSSDVRGVRESDRSTKRRLYVQTPPPVPVYFHTVWCGISILGRTEPCRGSYGEHAEHGDSLPDGLRG